jgi:hypothetical protein
MMNTLTTHRADSILHHNLKRDVLGGVLAGQIAGLIMAAVMVVVFTAFLGKAPYFPVQVIGSFATGDAALAGFHLPSFLAGLAIHQAVATLLWSFPFGLVMNKAEQSWIHVALVGLGIGVASQVIDVGFIVPGIMNALHGHDIWAANVPNFWSWAAHIVFGLGFLLFIPIRARLERASQS